MNTKRQKTLAKQEIEKTEKVLREFYDKDTEDRAVLCIMGARNSKDDPGISQVSCYGNGGLIANSVITAMESCEGLRMAVIAALVSKNPILGMLAVKVLEGGEDDE